MDRYRPAIILSSTIVTLITSFWIFGGVAAQTPATTIAPNPGSSFHEQCPASGGNINVRLGYCTLKVTNADADDISINGFWVKPDPNNSSRFITALETDDGAWYIDYLGNSSASGTSDLIIYIHPDPLSRLGPSTLGDTITLTANGATWTTTVATSGATAIVPYDRDSQPCPASGGTLVLSQQFYHNICYLEVQGAKIEAGIDIGGFWAKPDPNNARKYLDANEGDDGAMYHRFGGTFGNQTDGGLEYFINGSPLPHLNADLLHGKTVTVTAGAASYSLTLHKSVRKPTVNVTTTGSDWIEAGDTARFTVTATPAQPTALAVELDVDVYPTTMVADGVTGTRTVTIPPSGSVNFDVPTIAGSLNYGQSGHIWVQPIQPDDYNYWAGSDDYYNVEASTADRPPHISMTTTASNVTEGDTLTFTLTANRTLDTALDVSVDVQEHHASRIAAADLGQRTVTIPVGGSTSFTLAIPDDDDFAVDSQLVVELEIPADNSYSTDRNNYRIALMVAENDAEPTLELAEYTLYVHSILDTNHEVVTEGEPVGIMVSVSPSPSEPLAVPVAVSQAGDFLRPGDVGDHTVNIPAYPDDHYYASDYVRLQLPTLDDDLDEPDGSVTFVVDGRETVTIAVRDNEEPPLINLASHGAVTEGSPAEFSITANPAPESPLTVSVTVEEASLAGSHADAADLGNRQVTIPTNGTATFSVNTENDGNDEPDGLLRVALNENALRYYLPGAQSEAWARVQDDDQAIAVSIAAGSPVTEGQTASFTVTADPAPQFPLSVGLTVGQLGDYVASSDLGPRTVTIPIGGSAVVNVNTVNDAIDENEGAVGVTLAAPSGYWLASDRSAQVPVSDNDASPALVTLAAPDTVDAGDTITFTLTADPAPATSLDVAVTVSQFGNYTSGVGSQTVTITNSGSANFNVATDAGSQRRSDGVVAASVEAGAGYVRDGDRTRTVTVTNDNPLVTLSDAETTEGGWLDFTVTLDRAYDAEVTIHFMAFGSLWKDTEYCHGDTCYIYTERVEGQAVELGDFWQLDQYRRSQVTIPAGDTTAIYSIQSVESYETTVDLNTSVITTVREVEPTETFTLKAVRLEIRDTVIILKGVRSYGTIYDDD